MARRPKPKRSATMAERVVKEISPSSAKKDTRLKNLACKQEEEEPGDGSPLRPIFCLKKNVDMKRIEEMEDCFILEFNPFDSVDIATKDSDDVDISVVAEKGQVACRDYPHSRHLCLQYPFDTTTHERHCDLCYCYVCDSAAPCECWMTHCHASEHVEDWKSQRNLRIQKVRPGNYEEAPHSMPRFLEHTAFC
ncbi:uncharacterized protein LOC111291110 [Durio zibethinus]|uniref:Uncharacterized protein LOC111291110 n=1 Tax=Durio zibethinus TaxID=66656 RepID=A0A6P5YDJ0_DURZI|nr:uncharacterized protein LOC111291110 [Durio zibethinus]